jgi:hypothetical protein
MYTIKPLNPSDGSLSSFIDDDVITKMKMTNHCFITDIYLLNKLSKMKFPVRNRRIATVRILEFLTFLDVEMNMNDYGTLIQIPCKTMEKFFTRNHVVEYKQILKNLKIITGVPYPDGSFYKYPDLGSQKDQGICMQYRVHKNYITPKHLGLVIFDRVRKPKIQPKVINEIPDLSNKYIKTMEMLKIDIPSAIKGEFEYFRITHQNLFRLKARISIVLRTERDRFIRKGENVDRIYHTFSNVSRISRKYLNIEFNNVDVKNCQPLLLVSYLKKNKMDLDQDYKQDCESSLFYDRFIGTQGLDKEAAKVRLYKVIFFGFNKRSIFNKKFKKLYPKTWQSLLDLKTKKVSLAAELQNLESSLFNFIIPPKSAHFFTLYDAIYFTNFDDIEHIIQKIEDFFMDLGTNVQIRINDEEITSAVI